MFTHRSVNFDFFIYSSLLVSTTFINKYVLSVLKFTYPTVFQAWQTLVGAVVLQYLTMQRKLEVSCLDKSLAIRLLPHCLFYVGSIVAGSKALSQLPAAVWVAAGNAPGAAAGLAGAGVASGAGAAAAVALGALAGAGALHARALPSASAGYAWLLVHVALATLPVLQPLLRPRHRHHPSDDPAPAPAPAPADRVYYANVFSVVLLAPSSLYVEEAFAALHFAERRQLRFVASCACSGLLGAALQLRLAAAGAAPGAGPRVEALARLLCAAAASAAAPLLATPPPPPAAQLLLVLSLAAAPFAHPPPPPPPPPPAPEEKKPRVQTL